MLNRSEPRPKLSGQRNQCPSCLELFNTNAGFDKHRAGSHTHGTRHCLTVAEMEEKGMVRNAAGFWIMPVPEEDRARLAKMRFKGDT